MSILSLSLSLSAGTLFMDELTVNKIQSGPV